MFHLLLAVGKSDYNIGLLGLYNNNLLTAITSNRTGENGENRLLLQTVKDLKWDLKNGVIAVILSKFGPS